MVHKTTNACSFIFTFLDSLAEKKQHVQEQQSPQFFVFFFHLAFPETNSYTAEADFGFTERGAASHQAEDEHRHADADDNSGWDEGLPVLDETLKGVIAPDHVGTDISQRCSCALWGRDVHSICFVSHVGNGFTVTGSRAPTTLNQSRLAGNEPVSLKEGCHCTQSVFKNIFSQRAEVPTGSLKVRSLLSLAKLSIDEHVRSVAGRFALGRHSTTK